jgi:UDP-N-acetylmuramyl pentapeptide phosphotransferase/UDP-N-acetylglucosamine-1-phosphate transferase
MSLIHAFMLSLKQELYILFACATSFIIVVYAIPYILKLAQSNNLFDSQKDYGEHKEKIPTLGGTAIFAAVIFSLTFWTDFSDTPGFQFLVAALLILFYIGIKDDLLPMKPLTKLMGQTLSACVIVLGGKAQIKTLHGLLGIYELHPIFSIIFTITFIVLVINAFNFIDGVDGLAPGLGLLLSIIYGIVFYFSEGKLNYCIESFALAGALSAFLIYNFHPAKILMGDTGSLLIGCMAAQLSIRFMEISPETQFKYLPAGPLFAFSMVLLPVFDLLRVTVFRLLNGKNPLKADRSHIHHFLLSMGYSHKKTCIILFASSFMMALFAYANRFANINLIFWMLVAFSIILTGVAYYKKNKKIYLQKYSSARILESELIE